MRRETPVKSKGKPTIKLTMPATKYTMPSHARMVFVGPVTEVSEDIDDSKEFMRGLSQRISKPLISVLPPSPATTAPAIMNFKYGRNMKIIT